MQNIVPWPYPLRKGHSKNPAKGACIMDAINWLVHGQHGDQPPCVDPIFINFCIVGNDTMPDDIRQKFLLRAHLLAGSFDPETRDARLRILVMGALRIFLPMALDDAGLHDKAKKFRDLPDDVSYEELLEVIVNKNKTKEVSWAEYCEVEAESWATLIAGATRIVGVAETTKAWIAETAAKIAKIAKWVSYVAGVAVWDKYFEVLDIALAAGKTGQQWSACDIESGITKYKIAVDSFNREIA